MMISRKSNRNLTTVQFLDTKKFMSSEESFIQTPPEISTRATRPVISHLQAVASPGGLFFSTGDEESQV